MIGKLGFQRNLNPLSNHSKGREQTNVKQDSGLYGAKTAVTGEQLVTNVASNDNNSKKDMSRIHHMSDSSCSDLMQVNHLNGLPNSALIAQLQSYRARNHLLLKTGAKWFSYRVSCF